MSQRSASHPRISRSTPLVRLIAGLAFTAMLVVGGGLSATAAEDGESSGVGFSDRPDDFVALSTGVVPTAFPGTEFNINDGPASALTDGNPATMTGGYNGPLDFVLDLGHEASIGHVSLQFGRFWDGPNEVQYSSDGENWSSMFQANGTEYMHSGDADPAAANELGYLLASPVTARYVRVTTKAWAQLFEATISGPSTPVDTAFQSAPANVNLVSRGGTVTALGGASFNPGEGAAQNMVDGDMSTKSGGLGLVDFMIDLGEVRSLAYVSIAFDRFWDGPNQLATSTDGVTWTPVLSASGAEYMQNPEADPAGPNTLGAQLANGASGRYVRLTAKDWANIFELEVFSADSIGVESLSLLAPVATTVVGLPIALTPTIAPSIATNQGLKWSTDGNATVAIDPISGILVASSPGRVSVTASSLDNAAVSAAADVSIAANATTWQAIEMALSSTVDYANPFEDVQVDATFTGPNGEQLVRPAFWDGADIWRVRFAPTVAGEWHVSIDSTDASNSGLHLPTTSFEVTDYEGPLDVYKHGFPRVSDSGPYFEYADGTPFFYLGDTHWTTRAEDWDSSNVEGVPSQFKYEVDHRSSQGFTVYQSQILDSTGLGLNVSAGVTQSTIDQLRDVDRKYAYVADAGLVNANASWTWTSQLTGADPELLDQLGRQWGARYGAYPVMWTTAQEVDDDFYGGTDPALWKRLAASLKATDAYDHPLTAHMETRSDALNSGWGDEPFHDFYAVQTQSASRSLYQDAWQQPGIKPVVTFETAYELNRSTAKDSRRFAYRSFLNGSLGLGYGVQGEWATNQSPDDWFHYGPYYRWFDGLNSDGGHQMEIFGSLLSSLNWWTLDPAFGDDARADFLDGGDVSLASAEDGTQLAYFSEGPSESPGSLLALDGSGSYTAWWFDPRTGDYHVAANEIRPDRGRWQVPSAPTTEDWVLIVRPTSLGSPPLVVKAVAGETTIAEAGGTLQLEAWTGPQRADVTWHVTSTSGDTTDAASVDQNGVVTAARNGVVLVCAESTTDSDCRSLVLLRQDAPNALAITNSMTIEEQPGRQLIARIVPANVQNQRVLWTVTELDGTPTTKAIIGDTGVLGAMESGDVLVTATTTDGSGISAQLVYSIRFDDQITNPLLQGAIASASSTDYSNDYRPQKALTSTHGDWAGWTSDLDETTSVDAPQWLAVQLPEPRTFNTLDVYTTGAGYQLRSYDVQVQLEGKWVTVAQVRDSQVTHVSNSFPAVTTDQFRVLAYQGDALGISRISALEPSWNPDSVSPPISTTEPTVSGELRIGATLHGDPGVWIPAETDKSIQWLRDGEPIADATAADYRVAAEDEGHDIAIRVTARASGLETERVVEAGSIPVSSVPDSPVGVVAAASADGIVVTWSAPGSDGGRAVTEYRIYISDRTDAVGVVTSDSTSLTIKGLQPGSSHAVAVSAVNSVGEGQRSPWTDAVIVSGSIVQPPTTDQPNNNPPTVGGQPNSNHGGDSANSLAGTGYQSSLAIETGLLALLTMVAGLVALVVRRRIGRRSTR